MKNETNETEKCSTADELDGLVTVVGYGEVALKEMS